MVQVLVTPSAVVGVFLVRCSKIFLPLTSEVVICRNHPVSCIVFIIGVVMQTIATAIPLFTAGRAVAGFGVGLLSVLVPLYQSECSPKWIRGAIISA